MAGKDRRPVGGRSRWRGAINCGFLRIASPHEKDPPAATRDGRHRVALRALDRRAARRGPGGVRARVFHLAGRGRRPGPLLAHRRVGHLLDLPPAAHPPQLRSAAPVARIRLHGHRLLCLGGRRDRLGLRPPQAPCPRRRRAGRPQPRPRPRLGPHALVDDARRHPRPRPGILLEVGTRPRSRPGPSRARPVPLHLPTAFVRGPLCRGRPALAGLGRLRPVVPGTAFDLAGQLGHARLGLPQLSDPRHLDEPLVGGPAHLRRGLAQQPPCVPDLGPARPAVVGARRDLLGHPPHGLHWRWPTASSGPGSSPRRSRGVSRPTARPN